MIRLTLGLFLVAVSVENMFQPVGGALTALGMLLLLSGLVRVSTYA